MGDAGGVATVRDAPYGCMPGGASPPWLATVRDVPYFSKLNQFSRGTY